MTANTSPPTILGILIPCVIALVVLLWLAGPWVSDASPGSRKDFVLFFDSYHPGYPWSEDVRSGVRGQWHKVLPELDLQIEFMDTKHHPPEALFPILAQLYARKYADKKPVLIVSSDNNALNFLIKYRQRLFPGIPIVFCGVNNFKDALIQGQKEITGVVEAASFDKTIELILALHPGATAIYSIAGSSVTTGIHIRELADVVGRFAGRIEFIGLHNLSMAQFAAELEKIPPTGIVLWLGLFLDNAGTSLTQKEAFEFIRSHTDRPIYTMWSHDLAYCLGGVIINGREQGRQAARMAARIFRGAPPGTPAVIRESPNVPMFNYNEMCRFDIPVEAVPAESVIINRPPLSFYTQYRYHIWSAAIAIVVLSAMVAALSVLHLLKQKAVAELRKARNYIANIIDSMPSVVISVDSDCNVTQWNDKAARMTGISAIHALGKPLERVFSDLACERSRVHDAMKSQEVHVESRRPIKGEDGTQYEDLTIYPLAANGMEGAVIRLDNVTEQVQLEEIMVQSEKMISVGGLAAGMAHEINNPLAGMIQAAEVMGNRLTNPNISANLQAATQAGTSMQAVIRFMELRGIPQMLENIRLSGSRAADIVANMLGFARRSDGTVSFNDMVQLMDQTIELASTDYDLKKDFDFRRIRIIRNYAKVIPQVPCEAGQIQQVLLNILRNGAQAMQMKWQGLAGDGEDAGPRFIISLDHIPEKGLVRMKISDNGPGLGELDRKRVFEPFFTTKPIGQGTGLGLSVSYFIITENHGGQMRVESVPGTGTTFIIELPVHRKPLDNGRDRLTHPLPPSPLNQKHQTDR